MSGRLRGQGVGEGGVGYREYLPQAARKLYLLASRSWSVPEGSRRSRRLEDERRCRPSQSSRFWWSAVFQLRLPLDTLAFAPRARAFLFRSLFLFIQLALSACFLLDISVASLIIF